MAQGAVAQPVTADQYKAEKIPLSNAYGAEMFFHYGTKTVTPDLIFRPGVFKKAETYTTPPGGLGAYTRPRGFSKKAQG